MKFSDFVKEHRPLVIAGALLLFLAAVVALVLAASLPGGAAGAASATVTAGESGYLSPADVAVYDHFAFFADATSNQVIKVDLNGAASVAMKNKDVGLPVNGVYADENHLYALEGGLDGKVAVLDQNASASATISVGHTPVAAVSSEDGRTLYVVNRFSGDLSVVDLSENKVTATLPVGREPMAIVRKENKLYIALHLPESAASDETVSAAVAVVSTDNLSAESEVKKIPLVSGSQGVKDLAFSSDGKYLYTVSVISRYAYPTTQLQEGWVNTNGINIIDTQTDTLLTAVLLDDSTRGAANPSGIAVTGGKIAVTIAGENQLMIVDEAAMLQKLQAVPEGEIAAVADDLTFLTGLKTRVPLQGKGPRAVEVIAEGEVMVADYFSAQGERVKLDDPSSTSVISLGESAEPGPVRRGEILWNDSTSCFQAWESCASCHPDARMDALNWDNLNDGLGNHKNTASMVYSYRTSPVMATGARESGELASRRGMLYIQYGKLSDEEMGDIDAYLRSLQPIESPYLNKDGTLTASAESGKALFESEGCVTCHPAPLYTDRTAHKSPYSGEDGTWENREMYTPSLVECWRAAPYSYTGMQTDMVEIVKRFDADKSLTEQQAKDLAAFVLSIGDAGESYGVVEVFTREGEGEEKAVLPVPGSALSSFTVMKQSGESDEATVKWTLSGGSEGEVTGELKLDAMSPGDTATLSFGEEPPVFAEGTTLTIEIADGEGNALASPYRLTCKAAGGAASGSSK